MELRRVPLYSGKLDKQTNHVVFNVAKVFSPPVVLIQYDGRLKSSATEGTELHILEKKLGQNLKNTRAKPSSAWSGGDR